MRGTPEQLVDRWEAQRDLKNLMGKYAMTMLLEQRNQAFERFWSGRADVCLGVNEGWYAGPEAIQGYYLAQAARVRAESELLCQLFPERTADYSPAEKEALGHLDNRPVSAPVICVAQDMRTARGMWTSVGCYNEVSSAYGPQSHWSWQVFAVDFIWEKDGWRVWHMRQLTELDALCGADWSKPQREPERRPEFQPLEAAVIPGPNRPCALHQPWSPQRLAANLPGLPQPYVTFGETGTYGMEGEWI